MFNHNYTLLLVNSAKHNLIGKEFEWLNEVDNHDEEESSSLEEAFAMYDKKLVCNLNLPNVKNFPSFDEFEKKNTPFDSDLNELESISGKSNL